MTKRSGYLARLETRRAAMNIKRCIVFGLFVSLVATGLGGVNTYLVTGARDFLWIHILWAGVFGLFLTLVFPSAWSGPEWVFRTVASKFGETIFKILLTLVYFLLFYPIGALMRLKSGVAPIFHWDNNPPANLEGWVNKKINITSVKKHDVRGNLLLQPFAVVGFFFRSGQYLLLPVIMLLLGMGLVLFFVQTSALAPFIYTLF